MVPLAAAATLLATMLFAPLPAVLPDPRPGMVSQPSKVYLLEANGDRRQISVFREFEQNLPVNKPDIPRVLKDAVVAAEDKNFYSHGGVDPRGACGPSWPTFAIAPWSRVGPPSPSST